MYSGVLKMMATCLKTLIWWDCNSACHISPLSCSLKNTTEMSSVNRSYNSLVTCKTIKAHYIVSDVPYTGLRLMGGSPWIWAGINSKNKRRNAELVLSVSNCFHCSLTQSFTKLFFTTFESWTSAKYLNLKINFCSILNFVARFNFMWMVHNCLKIV